MASSAILEETLKHLRTDTGEALTVQSKVDIPWEVRIHERNRAVYQSMLADVKERRTDAQTIGEIRKLLVKLLGTLVIWSRLSASAYILENAHDAVPLYSGQEVKPGDLYALESPGNALCDRNQRSQPKAPRPSRD